MHHFWHRIVLWLRQHSRAVPVEWRFFSSLWTWGAAFVLVLGVLTGQPALRVLGASILAAITVSWVWTRVSLDGVEVTIQLAASRLFPEEQTQLTVSVVNRRWLPIPWLEIVIHLADRLQVAGADPAPSERYGMVSIQLTTALRWRERIRLPYTLSSPERGAFAIGPVDLRAGDLFGFFSRAESRPVTLRLLVYPHPLTVPALVPPPQTPSGEARLPRALLADPFRPIGVRDYRPEDSLRLIHWKATARTQRLMVKQFEPAASLQLALFLNLETTERPWEGFDLERAESVIAAAAAFARDALAARWAVGIYANGVLAGSDQPLRLGPSSGPSQLRAIMEALAKLTPLAALRFTRFLAHETSRLPPGCTIAVVTPLLSPTLVQLLAQQHLLGRPLVLVTLGQPECIPPVDLPLLVLPERLVHHTPRYSLPLDTHLPPSPISR